MPPQQPDRFSRQIEQKAERKLAAQRQRGSVWFGLGMFGLVGYVMAWQWLGKEDTEIHQDKKNSNDEQSP